jgi:predicted permease
MTVFFTLLGKIIPLYFSIILGVFSTAILKCNKETIAKILLFLLGPLITLNATINVKFDLSVVFLPIYFFTFSTVLAFTVLYFAKKIYNDNTANLLAFSTATGNTGNLGIPLAIIFLEPSLVDIFIFTVLASLLYQNSVGYYITAKGNFSTMQSIKKVIKLPVLHAFILGLIVNLNDIQIPQMFADYSAYLKGAYVILGMMLIGMGLEKFRSDNSIDIKFISLALFVKFIIWPLVTIIFIFLDKNFFHILTESFI